LPSSTASAAPVLTQYFDGSYSAHAETSKGANVADLVVGADIGGTATRVAVADLSGRILSLATGGPGNPNAVGTAGSAAQICAVMSQALAGVDGDVSSVVIGLAGASRTDSDQGFLRAAVPERVLVQPVLVSDLAVAFSSATPRPRGYVILSGTGAVAGEIVEDVVVAQRDGWGWLLGDEGSGFWLGRAAVRATLRGLQEGQPLGRLQRGVLTAAGATDYPGLLRACYAATPTWLARFAPLVAAHCDADPAAAEIAELAVGRLSELLLSLDPRPGEPIVLAGSVLTSVGPISRAFLARIGHRLSNPLLHSTIGVIGALWIATRSRAANAVQVHAKLVRTAGDRV
jgi:glucosamine kinase